MPMPSDMYGAVSDRSGSDGAEEPIAEYIAKAYYVTHSLQTMRFSLRGFGLPDIFVYTDFCCPGRDGEVVRHRFRNIFPNAAAYLFA